jgi:hypothetical protein
METIRKNSSMIVFVAVIALVCSWAIFVNAGSLNPSAPPAPTMKTLDEIYAKIDTIKADRRTPISSSDLPLTISQSGSYYLVETINFATQNTTGITITANDVTIDLNGYALIGPGKATGSSGNGISASGQRITVLNGSVCQWRGDGIQLGGIGNQVRYVNSAENGGQGINVQKGSNVNNCTVASNNANGIYAWDGSVVSECICYENNGNGIHGRMGVVVRGCSIYENESSEGLSVGEGSAVDNCSILRNWDGDGIIAGYGSVITNCSVYDNDDGILGGRYLTIKGCNFRDNGSYGIDTCDSLIYGNSSTGHTNNLTPCNNSAWNNHAP